MECWIKKIQIINLDKCDAARTARGNLYCSLACNPEEHKALLKEDKVAHKQFNKAFGSK